MGTGSPRWHGRCSGVGASLEPAMFFLCLLHLLLACQPDAMRAWSTARAACDLDHGEHPADTLLADRPALELGEACREQLTLDLGVDLDSFQADGERGQRSLEALLHGAHLLIAGDFGTVGAFLDSEDAARSGWERMAPRAEQLELSPADPAGALLYDHVGRSLSRIALDPELEGHGAIYRAGTMRLAPVEEGLVPPPTWMAGVLVHEASHRTGPNHVPCEEGGAADCDPDLDGVYGTQAWMLETWRQHLDLGAPYAAEACADSVHDLAIVCSMVLDDQGDDRCDPLARWDICDGH